MRSFQRGFVGACQAFIRVKGCGSIVGKILHVMEPVKQQRSNSVLCTRYNADTQAGPACLSIRLSYAVCCLVLYIYVSALYPAYLCLFLLCVRI